MLQGFLVYEVVNVVTPSFPFDQPNISKDAQVLGNSRLGNTQEVCQGVYTEGIRGTLLTKEFK